MKNLLLIIGTFFVITAGAQSADSAKPQTSITICDKDPQKVTVVINNPLFEKLTLEVSSPEHGTLLTRTVQTVSFLTNLDFSEAPDGEYTVEVSCRSREKVRKTVHIETREFVYRTAALSR